jgi:hypothetical protein
MTNFQGREQKQNWGAAIQSTGGGDRWWTDPGIRGALIALAVTREAVASPIGSRAGFRAMARVTWGVIARGNFRRNLKP